MANVNVFLYTAVQTYKEVYLFATMVKRTQYLIISRVSFRGHYVGVIPVATRS